MRTMIRNIKHNPAPLLTIALSLAGWAWIFNWIIKNVPK